MEAIRFFKRELFSKPRPPFRASPVSVCHGPRVLWMCFDFLTRRRRETEVFGHQSRLTAILELHERFDLIAHDPVQSRRRRLRVVALSNIEVADRIQDRPATAAQADEPTKLRAGLDIPDAGGAI